MPFASIATRQLVELRSGTIRAKSGGGGGQHLLSATAAGASAGRSPMIGDRLARRSSKTIPSLRSWCSIFWEERGTESVRP